MKFSEWLVNEMEKRGWKQADLARASSLHRAVISYLINEKRKPGEITVVAIAKAFKLPPEEVFRVAGILPPKPDPNHNPSLAEWMNIFDQASPETQQQLLDMARALSQFKEKGK